MKKKKGFLIVFEGIGASGKDTQAKMAYEYLLQRGVDVLSTREHTRDTPPGELIEEIIKGKKSRIDPLALQLLYTCDRRNHDMDVIRPAIKEGKVVLGNRSYATTVAYCPKEWRQFILKTNKKIATHPELVFIIDTSPEVSALRMKKRGDPDIFDRTGTMKRCRGGYLWYVKNSGDKCVLVDGNGTVEEVFERIKKRLDKLLRLV